MIKLVNAADAADFGVEMIPGGDASDAGEWGASVIDFLAPRCPACSPKHCEKCPTEAQHPYRPRVVQVVRK